MSPAVFARSLEMIVEEAVEAGVEFDQILAGLDAQTSEVSRLRFDVEKERESEAPLLPVNVVRFRGRSMQAFGKVPSGVAK